MAFSDVIDDLGARVDQVKNLLPQEFNDYLKIRATEQFIKITDGERGNITAEDIARGIYGQPPAIAGAGGNAASMNAISASQIMPAMGGWTIPILFVSALGVWFLLKKRK